MSKSHSQTVQGIEPLNDTDQRQILSTVVAKTVPADELPLWDENRTACWAIEDTIRRVAPEANA